MVVCASEEIGDAVGQVVELGFAVEIQQTLVIVVEIEAEYLVGQFAVAPALDVGEPGIERIEKLAV